jgi:hypothetical protein
MSDTRSGNQTLGCPVQGCPLTMHSMHERLPEQSFLTGLSLRQAIMVLSEYLYLTLGALPEL